MPSAENSSTPETSMTRIVLPIYGKEKECHSFYTDFLGIPEVPTNIPGFDPNTDDLPFFWIEKQGVQVHVISMPKSGAPRDPANNHVSWYVEDINATIAAIKEQGLEMDSLGEGLDIIVWTTDPAGNIVEFQQDPDFKPMQ